MKALPALIAALSLLSTLAFAGAPWDAWEGSVVDWSREVDRSEALLGSAAARGRADPAYREATVTQIRAGAKSLRDLLLATTASDSLLAGPLISAPPPYRRPGEWGNRFIRATGVVAVTAGLANLAAGLREADPELRQTLGYVSGVSGGVGALFSLLRPRPKPPPYVDPVERARTMFREELLRDTFTENSRRLQELAGELNAIHSDPASTDSAMVALVHRYAGALELASALYDTQVPHAMTLARMSAAYPSFSTTAHDRLSQLADHLDRVGAEWRAWRWLVGRSQRGALGYLTHVDQP